MIDLLAQLKGVARAGDGWTARCPAHDDRHNSLSIHHRDGRWLLRCHAGCTGRRLLMPWAWMLPICSTMGKGEGVGLTPPTTAQLSNGHANQWALRGPGRTWRLRRPGQQGLTLEQYAAAKGLPIDFLKILRAVGVYLRPQACGAHPVSRRGRRTTCGAVSDRAQW